MNRDTISYYFLYFFVEMYFSVYAYSREAIEGLCIS